MNKLYSVKRWKTLGVVFASLLVFLIVVTGLANKYAPLINATLNLKTYYTVDDGDGTADTNYFPAKYTDENAVKNFASDVCERVEGEGLVLLKNDGNALPMAENSKVSLFLTGSVEWNCSAQGLRNTTDKTKYPTLKQALESVGASVNEQVWNYYVKCTTGSKNNGAYGGYRKYNEETGLQTGYINEAPWSGAAEFQGTFAEYGDAAIAVVTRDATEGADAVTHGSDGKNGNYMALSNEEYEALRQLTILRQKGVFKRVIVLLNCASPLQLDFLNDESVQVDALMWVGNTGMSGVNAVAKALVGKINPSGRLSDTYVYDNFSSPAMTNWMLSDNGAFALSWNDSRFDENLKAVQQYYGQYVEGIYVGYRYYETRYADMVEGMANVGLYDYAQTVAYPFGYGLSYTEFDYSAMSVIKNTDGKGYTVEVTVTNVGENAGKEVVQVYLSKPYTDYAKKHHIEVSSVELVGFAKTDVLQPDQSVTVTINIDKADFASYDVYGAGTYIIDAGQYLLTVAKDAHEANNNVLAYKDFGVRNGMTADGNASLVKLAEDVATIDKTTYAVSTETGAEVSNKLASGDINRYSGAEDNSVTYVSRSNWQDTFPTEKAEIRLTDRMFEDLQVVDIADVKSVGEMPNFGENNGLTLVMMRGKGIDDPDWDKLLSQMSFDELDTLLTTCISQTPYVASVTKPQTKEMDGPTYCKEGVTDSRFPCEGIWASTFNTALVEEVGEALANDARLAGYSGMWIPGINIHRTPYGGRNHEYFSEDPVLTGVMAEAEIKSLQRYGVIAQPKHYAFNEQEIFRGGIGVWLDEQTAREIYLKPWKYAVSPDRGNAHALMTSFNRFGTKWTSADINLVSILRDEFGFEGYIITDMADAVGTQYMVALDGILAGTDCWLSSGSHSFAAYKNNATVVTAMRNAAKRMMYNVTNYSCAMNGISNTMRIVKIATWWEITLTTLIVVFAVLSAASITLLVLSEVKRNKKD